MRTSEHVSAAKIGEPICQHSASTAAVLLEKCTLFWELYAPFQLILVAQSSRADPAVHLRNLCQSHESTAYT